MKCLQLNRLVNIKIYGFKNLHIVDLDGALTGETVNLDIIEEIIKKFDLKLKLVVVSEILKVFRNILMLVLKKLF